MAQGMFIRVTHLGASDGSLLLSDIADATDGAIHELSKAGAVYVPDGGSSDLIATSDVVKSFESGAIRKAIDEGLVTATFEHGDAVGQTLTFTVAAGATVACAALGKLISVTAVTSAANVLNGSLTVASGGDNMADPATAGLSDLNGVLALDMEDEAADIESGDRVTMAWADDNGNACTVQLTFAG